MKTLKLNQPHDEVSISMELEIDKTNGVFLLTVINTESGVKQVCNINLDDNQIRLLALFIDREWLK